MHCQEDIMKANLARFMVAPNAGTKWGDSAPVTRARVAAFRILLALGALASSALVAGAGHKWF